MDTHKQQLNKNPNYRELTEKEKEEEEDVPPLPGFRFHPTDEELVAFYLHHKVKKIPISIELIKEIDIYKYDPWDLPKGSNVGEKEWYFFCRRGRKYRNSIRPNRVTGSGFWKATGIDRPIYSGDGSVCIGLKKSLVYYRGSAGKGTKTDWMMHEFRLPPPSDAHNNHMINQKSVTQEAEVWTLCRILKRTPCHKKSLPEWSQVPTRRSTPAVDTSSGDSDYDMQSYISFQAPVTHENKPYLHNHPQQQRHGTNQMIIGHLTTSVLTSEAPSATASCSSFSGIDVNDVIKHGDWDDLISLSVVDQYAVADPLFFT